PALGLGIAALALLGGSLCAQLDLPRGRSRPADTGLDLPSRPRRNLAPGSGGGLDLPRGAAPPAVPPERAPAAPASHEASPAGAAAFLLAELAREPAIDGSVARSARDGLIALGEPGIAAARAALASDHAPTMVVGAEVLLGAGSPADRRAVADRLAGAVPPAAAVAVLDTLLAADPVVASPIYLVSLLDHRALAVREAAERALAPGLTAEHLSLLAPALAARRADTRLRCVELAGRLADPAAERLLVDRLADESSRVAWRCAELLAGRDEPAATEALLARAFAGPVLDRCGAYALLSLIRREERTGERLLGEERVPVLLAGLRAPEPLVAGAAAAALAGIGFASPHPAATPWLDLEVPHELVQLAAGLEFHRDFASLQPIALRRLALITGQPLGADGAAWQRWWMAAAKGFRARRASLDVAEGEEAGLEILYRPASAAAESIRLRGPTVAAPPDGGPSTPGALFHLTARECRDLVDLLRREGALGPEHLPGPAADPGARARLLDVSVHGRGKRFAVAEGGEDPWFERLAGAVQAVAERNRWQLFPDLSCYPDARSAWAAESAWWELDHPAAERDRRFVAQLLAAAAAAAPAARDPHVGELARLYAHPGVPQAIDLSAFLDLLAAEPFLGERADSLVDLAIAAARAAGEGGAGAAVDATLAQRIVDVLAASQGERAAPAVERVLAAADPSFVREAVQGGIPFLRAMGARVLAADPDPAARDLVLALLDDPDPRVEAAAVGALGRHRVEAARTAILLRARLAGLEVRAAALRAAGELGGEGALDVLRLGVFEVDPHLQLAGAEGLAALADPESAGLLVRLLSRGRGSPFFAPAEQGLRALGRAAWDDLRRASNSGAEATQRDASLLLAEQGVPDVATNLLTILTKNPGDARVAQELAVLTCIDFRGERDPAQAWWNWWDGVVHDDSLAWLCAAAERAGISAPPVAALGPPGTREGALFLVRLLGNRAEALAERARRELSRMLDGDVGDAPPPGTLREAWIGGLAALVAERYAGGE
ncbi:MAG: HEAT repeat domain-containing protein, partial [Planctomycetota bacterium]